MKIVGRQFLMYAAVGLLALTTQACGDNTSASVDIGIDTTADTQQPDTGPPAFQPPPVWGLTTVIDENPDPNIVEVTLTADEYEYDFEGTKLSMFAYNQSIPGPLIQAKVGDRVIVHFQNSMNSESTTIHWHGLRISDQMDGSPRIQQPVGPGESFTYDFVVKEAGSYWYHPHINVNQQIELGLYGALVVHAEDEPEVDLERFLLLDDFLFDSNSGQIPGFMTGHMEGVHGRTGNYLWTNGKLSSHATAQVEQGTVERWRLANTANARTMVLSIEGAKFRVVGTDGGRLDEVYETSSLLMPVGVRFDLEVTYDTPGTAKLLVHVPVVENNQVVTKPFSMFEATVSPSSKTPMQLTWPTGAIVGERFPTRHVTYTLTGTQGPGGLQWTINGQAHAMEPLFTFPKGETVLIQLVNQAGPEHPFHLHGQFFRIVDNGNIWTQQPGLKDTVLVPGGETVEVVAYMDNPGQWMAHCHILEHALLGMMSEFVVE